MVCGRNLFLKTWALLLCRSVNIVRFWYFLGGSLAVWNGRVYLNHIQCMAVYHLVYNGQESLFNLH